MVLFMQMLFEVFVSPSIRSSGDYICLLPYKLLNLCGETKLSAALIAYNPVIFSLQPGIMEPGINSQKDPTVGAPAVRWLVCGQ